MLGPKQEAQGALFYEFSIEDHVPQDHLLRSIDRFVDLSGIRHHLAPFYSNTGRPSIDPELLIRMLLVGYCLGIPSERRLCEEVHLNLAYRWFCRLDLTDRVPDHSTFSKNRHGRFRDSDLLRQLFEMTVLVPSMPAMVDDLIVGFEDAVGEPAIPHELPNVFEGIELWTFGWPRYDADILGYDELGGHLPSRLIHEDYSMGTQRDGVLCMMARPPRQIPTVILSLHP